VDMARCDMYYSLFGVWVYVGRIGMRLGDVRMNVFAGSHSPPPTRSCLYIYTSSHPRPPSVTPIHLPKPFIFPNRSTSFNSPFDHGQLLLQLRLNATKE
jgi:hypothetical protein